MAIAVKDLATSAAKYATNAGRSSEEYSTNAQAAAGDWEKNTQAARGNYKDGISAANIETRFARGVAKAGAAKYARKIAAVGGNRYRPGVEAGAADWQTGFAPFASTLAALSLSVKKMRGDPSNYSRGEQVGKALNAKRLALLSSGG